MAIKKKDGSIDIEATWEQAIDRLHLPKNMPAIVQGNRGAPIHTVTERELQSLTRQLFAEVEEQCKFYTKGLGNDVMWVSDWLKMYWSAWNSGIDIELVYATVQPDVVYRDPLSFGRDMVGIQTFIDYNQAFYDSITDLAYYLIPGEVALQVSPKGDVLFMGRYWGCGTWSNPLRMYPFTAGSPEIPTTGDYIQGCPVDRYHLNPKTRKVFKGETLWDPLELLQLLRMMPKDDSLAFKALCKFGALATPALKLSRKLPFISA